MGGNVSQPPRPRLTDQQTQHPIPARRISDCLLLLLAESVGHELHDVLAVGAKHTQRAVLGVDEPTGATHDSGKDVRQLEVCGHGQHRIEEGCQTFLGTIRCLSAIAKILEQIVQVEALSGHPRRRCPAFAQLGLPRLGLHTGDSRWCP